MADITKCKGTDCPVKDECYRHTAIDGYQQSWFTEAPGEIYEGKFTCNMYWGENSEGIHNHLMETSQKENL